MSVFKRNVDAQKHVFDFASYIFRITAWWSAFALLLKEALGPGREFRADTGLIPFEVNVDLSVPVGLLIVVGLLVFAAYGCYMLSRLWVILTAVRDDLLPPERTHAVVRMAATVFVFSMLVVAILLTVLLIIRALDA